MKLVGEEEDQRPRQVERVPSRAQSSRSTGNLKNGWKKEGPRKRQRRMGEGRREEEEEEEEENEEEEVEEESGWRRKERFGRATSDHSADIVLTRPVDGSSLDSRCLITSWTEGNSFLACWSGSRRNYGSAARGATTDWRMTGCRLSESTSKWVRITWACQCQRNDLLPWPCHRNSLCFEDYAKRQSPSAKYRSPISELFGLRLCPSVSIFGLRYHRSRYTNWNIYISHSKKMNIRTSNLWVG